MTAPAILPANVDYTTKDFDALRTRLFQLIRSVFPEWTDDSVANFGNLLVELFAFVGDVLLYYMDNQARESRVVTARLRKSLIGLAKLVGYKPAGATAATVDVVLTFTPPPTGTLTIPRGDRAQTAEVTAPIFYQFLADLVVDPGTATAALTLENSATETPVTVGSTGLPNQSFLLQATPYLDGSALVSDAGSGPYDAASNPTGWREVDNFLASSSTDRHYTVGVDQNDRATVRFGSGVSGRVPSGGVTVAFKTGGGEEGRVEQGALSRMEKPTYVDSLGHVVKVAVTNAAGSSGGTNRESNAQIATNAPEALRVLRRAVAREDYEIVAQKVPGVARALMVTSNEYPGVQENEGLLLLATPDAQAPSGALLAAVSAQFDAAGPFPKPTTFQLHVQGAQYLTVAVTATVYLAPGAVAATVRALIQARLSAFFAVALGNGAPNPLINFGYYFQDQAGAPTGRFVWSDVFNVVRDTTGVGEVDAGPTGFLLNGLRADVPIDAIQFPRLGAVTLFDGATSLPL